MPFSFSGWNTFSIAPKTTPGLPAGVVEKDFGDGRMGNTLPPPKSRTTESGVTTLPTGNKTTTGTSLSGVPSTITDAMGGLGLGGNAAILSLIEKLFSGGGGGQPAYVQPTTSAGQDWAAIRRQIDSENERNRVAMLLENRKSLAFHNPVLPGMDYLSSPQRQLDREVENRLRVNIPSTATSGWVQSPWR